MSKRTFSKKSKNSRKTLKNKRVMRGGLDRSDEALLVFYILIILFVSRVISEYLSNDTLDNIKRIKKVGGGDSISFNKVELINKLKEYIKTDFNGINDSDKQKSVEFFTENIKNYGDNITVEQLDELKQYIEGEIKKIVNTEKNS